MSEFTTVPPQRDQLRTELIEAMGESQGLALFERLEMSPLLGLITSPPEFWAECLDEFMEGGVEALAVYS